MKKVAIYGQAYTISSEKEIQILLTVLQEYKVVVFFEKEFYDLLVNNKSLDKKYPTYNHFNDLSNSFDMMFTMGGDGTFLDLRSFNVFIIILFVLKTLFHRRSKSNVL